MTTSWLPYSTYLYLDFHLLCSMTYLKEDSRKICCITTLMKIFDYFRTGHISKSLIICKNIKKEWIYFSISARATFSGPAFSKKCGFTAGLTIWEDQDGFQRWWWWNGEGCHWCSYMNGSSMMSQNQIDDLIEGMKIIILSIVAIEHCFDENPYGH